MRLRRTLGATLVPAVVLATVALGLYGMTTPATASATPRISARPQVVFGRPFEGVKVTLGETSIGGPALWSLPGATPQVVLAWTGTDAAHRLNVRTGKDGLIYTAKRTLPETSPYRPAVSFSSGGRAGFVVLAWTGTDAQHTLNVEYLEADTLAPVRKLTLRGNTSFGAPGVAVFGGGKVALAWTDQAQNLKVMRISPQGQVLGVTTVGAASASAESTNLTLDRATGQLLLSWIEPFSTSFSPLFFSTSPDGEQWTAKQRIAETSDFAPSMAGISASNMPTHWLAWTGTAGDTAHHLNVQYTEHFPDWTIVNSKATLRETDLGAPALGFIGDQQQMLVAWTGTDAAHHLNVAVVLVPS